MGEITIDDLVRDDAEQSASDGSDGSGSGEWVTDLIEKLDDRGYLEPLIFGPEAAGSVDDARPEPDTTGQSDGPQIDADGIKTALLAVYDNAEKIPGVSDDPTVGELIKLIDAQPEAANKLIEQHL